MGRRRELLSQRAQLLEIREIMNSMKNLAYFETRKLGRYINSQQGVVTHIETTAADLLHEYPAIKPTHNDGQLVYLLLGSERGFCGDYNAAIIRELDRQQEKENHTRPLLIIVGNKLQQSFAYDEGSILLPGASATEETGSVLNQVVDTMVDLQAQYPGLRLQVLYQDPQQRQVINKSLLPPFMDLKLPLDCQHNPLQINLSAPVLLHELIEHYLFAALYAISYAALMAENQVRIEHLEQAIRRLDEKSEDISRRSNAMRQEEIIEEIEVILLNAPPVIKR